MNTAEHGTNSPPPTAFFASRLPTKASACPIPHLRDTVGRALEKEKDLTVGRKLYMEGKRHIVEEGTDVVTGEPVLQLVAKPFRPFGTSR